MSFIFKVKKENLIKAEDNISEEQGVEYRKGISFGPKFPKAYRKVVLTGIVMHMLELTKGMC